MSNPFENQLQDAIEENELRRMLEDGKDHQLMFLAAYFIDGQSINLPSIKPFTVGRTVRSLNELGETAELVQRELTGAMKFIDDRAAIVQRAAAVAGISMASLIVAREKDLARYSDTLRILGLCAALGEHGHWDDALGIGDANLKVLEDYLRETPLPEGWIFTDENGTPEYEVTQKKEEKQDNE